MALKSLMNKLIHADPHGTKDESNDQETDRMHQAEVEVMEQRRVEEQKAAAALNMKKR